MRGNSLVSCIVAKLSIEEMKQTNKTKHLSFKDTPPDSLLQIDTWMIHELISKAHEVNAFTKLGSLSPLPDNSSRNSHLSPPTSNPNHARQQAGAALWPSALFAEHVGG